MYQHNSDAPFTTSIDCTPNQIARKCGFYLSFFFFSSRRRHTRLTCDWSSDVCSSDLPPASGTRERLRSALGIPETAPVIGSGFRLYDEKQPLVWVETAALVAGARPDCHFVIVGAGPLRGAVLKRAQQGGFAERLHCPGASSEASGYLSMFDVFLLTSRAEGTPNVVLEASLAGVPVVATAAGGTAETIDDGVTGLLVRDGDIATLAARLLEVLDNAAWRASVRAVGPAFVKRCFG